MATVMRAVLERGGSASLVTLTMRHHAGHRLADCWSALGYAWSRVTSGKQWVADQELGGMLGWVRVVEATYGDNGWHLHIHALVCWDRPVSLAMAEIIGERMWGRWSAALERKGFESWVDSGGLDVRMASLDNSNLGDYFVKLAREVTSSYAKTSKGGRTPFGILRDIPVYARADDVERWWEWERASHGRRQLTWSRNDHDLRAWAGLGRERSDEEIAAEEALSGDDVLALTPETWQTVRRSPLAVQLLDAAELDGVSGAKAWLARRGLGWVPAQPARRGVP